MVFGYVILVSIVSRIDRVFFYDLFFRYIDIKY